MSTNGLSEKAKIVAVWIGYIGVCVGILEVAGLGACKGTSLSRLHRTVVAAEALAVHVVVVVLTIVGYIERGIIVPDDLLLAGILALVVHRRHNCP